MILCHTGAMNEPIIPYNPNLKEKARELRKNSTKSEIILWKYLKGKQMCGLDFHRQKPVDQYILDFFCPLIYLGIELDGYSHHFEETSKKDIAREKRLKRLGIKIIRFWDEDVYFDIENVLRVIELTVQKRKKLFKLK